MPVLLTYKPFEAAGGNQSKCFLSDDTGYCLDIGYQYNDPKCIKVMKPPAEQ